MSTVNSIHFLTQNALQADARSTLRFDNDFPSTLTLGQIIKGKVLRSYSEGRYAVSFAGQEKVVDSAIPLKTGEILYGRVIGIDEQVTLQRIQSNEGKPAANNALLSGGGHTKNPLEAFFLKHNVSVPAESKALMQSLFKAASKPQMMLNSGVILQKLGLPLNAALLKAIYRVLEKGLKVSANDDADTAKLSIPSSSSSEVVNSNQQVVAQLMSALLPKFSQGEKSQQKTVASDKQDDKPVSDMNQVEDLVKSISDDMKELVDEELQEHRLGRFLLNTQTEGSVSHRLFSFPIWLGDRLVEIEMAFFSQSPKQVKGDIQYQRLVFSLDSELLGHVEMSVAVANRHLKVDIASDDEAATQWLARYMPDLKSALTESDWQIDELTYRTHFVEADNEVLGSVIQHYVSQDSLSRLM